MKSQEPVVRKTKPELLLERLNPFAGRCRILQCNMTAENEVLLRNFLEGEVSRLARRCIGIC